MNHDDLPKPNTSESHRGPARATPNQTPPERLEDVLAQHLHDVDAEHALLLRMWNTPHPADDNSTPDGDAAADHVPEHAAAGLEAAPGHVTVLHQARALTVGDLRAALLGVPDDRPIAIDVPLDPGGFELHRHVLTSTGGAYLLLADEEKVLDPSFVLRTDFPTGLYELPTDTTSGAADADPR